MFRSSGKAYGTVTLDRFKLLLLPQVWFLRCVLLFVTFRFKWQLFYHSDRVVSQQEVKKFPSNWMLSPWKLLRKGWDLTLPCVGKYSLLGVGFWKDMAWAPFSLTTILPVSTKNKHSKLFLFSTFKLSWLCQKLCHRMSHITTTFCITTAWHGLRSDECGEVSGPLLPPVPRHHLPLGQEWSRIPGAEPPSTA